MLGDRFAYTLAVHTPLAKDNIEQPHFHLMFSERAVDETTRGLAEDKFFKRNGAKKAFAAPLRDIQQAASYVRQNMKEVSWLVLGLVFAGGLILGLLFGYWPMRSSQNNMQEQLNRIEQYLAAQQSSASPAAPNMHAPAHKGKAK